MRSAIVPVLALAWLLPACSATDESPYLLEISSTSHDFGAIAIGSESPAVTFSVRNAGPQPLVLTTSITGTNAAEFDLANDGCGGGALNSGDTCVVSVRFHPVSGGIKNAALQVADPTGDGPVAALRGNANAATLTISSTQVHFGDIKVGEESAPATITIRNGIAAPTGGLTVALETPSSEFVTEADMCTGTVLAGGASCTIGLRLRPTSAGTKGARLTIAGSPGGEVAAELDGYAGIETSVQATPLAADFGIVRIGGSAPTIDVVVTNSGAAPTGLLLARIAGSGSDAFRPVLDSCNGTRLEPAATCSVRVEFGAATDGARAATLEVTSRFTAPLSIPLTGTAGRSILTLDVERFEFGLVDVGTTSPAILATITNTGSMPSDAAPVVQSAPECDWYYYSCSPVEIPVTENLCGIGPLDAGASCTFKVAIRPLAIGTVVGLVSVTMGESDPRSIPVAGTGAGLIVSTPHIAFPPTVVGSVSSPITLTVTNTGTSTTSPLAVTLPGSAFPTTDECSGVSLPSGGWCTIAIRFAPIASTIYFSGMITIAGTPGGAVSVTLAGQGL